LKACWPRREPNGISLRIARMPRFVRVFWLFAALLFSACANAPKPEPGMRFVEAEGIEVHVETWGAGQPVLLIHGASSDMGLWRPSVIPALSGHYQLNGYDRPGMGFTVKRPPNAETLAVQAKVAADVIEKLGLTKPIIVAHSWGGAVALRLALDRPDLISGMVLMAPVAYEWPGGVSWHIYWSANPVIGGLFNDVVTRPFVTAAGRDGVKGTFAPMPAPGDYYERAFVARATRPGAMAANAADLIVAKREVTAQQARYPDLRMPIAIFNGDSDTVVSPTIHAGQLAATLPNATHVVLKGVGHMPHEAEPQTLATLVDWVREEAGK
jgi:pimeloyl-ACP methyl ester carboxylesterase